MTKKQLFFSHTWRPDKLGRDTHQRVTSLVRNMQKLGWTTWLDEDDIMGNIVFNQERVKQTAGYHTVQWDATNINGEIVSTGVYLYKIQAGDFVVRKKMIFLK